MLQTISAIGDVGEEFVFGEVWSRKTLTLLQLFENKPLEFCAGSPSFLAQAGMQETAEEKAQREEEEALTKIVEAFKQYKNYAGRWVENNEKQWNSLPDRQKQLFPKVRT